MSTEPDLETAEIFGTLHRLVERARERERERRGLPCFADASGGNLVSAVFACEQVSAFRGCAFSAVPGACPREQLAAEWKMVRARLEKSRCPRPIAGCLLGALSGRRDLNGRTCVQRALEETDALVEVRQWLAAQAWALVLAGAPGIGKTVAACWPLMAREGIYVHASEIAKLDSATTRDGRKVGDLLAEALSAPFLVLDDAGTEHAGETAYGPTRVSDLLVARYDEGLPVVTTTNIGPAALRLRYGERLYDRLRDGGAFVELKARESLRGVQ